MVIIDGQALPYIPEASEKEEASAEQEVEAAADPEQSESEQVRKFFIIY